MEYNLLDEEERGGLLTEDYDEENRLRDLFRYPYYKTHGDDHRRNVDAAIFCRIDSVAAIGVF